MTRVRPTAKAISVALARRDKLARQLVDLDNAIALAGREWSREQGNIVPLRIEALRRAVAQSDTAQGETGSRRGAAISHQGE